MTTLTITMTTPDGFMYVKDKPGTAKPYRALMPWRYYSPRYKKYVSIVEGMRSDGATGAMDIESLAWWIHDQLCNTGRWDDGSECTNFQASMVLKDILKHEGRWVRDFWWFALTFLLGGGEARRNGMITLKSEETRKLRSESYRYEWLIRQRIRVSIITFIVIGIVAGIAIWGI